MFWTLDDTNGRVRATIKPEGANPKWTFDPDPSNDPTAQSEDETFNPEPFIQYVRNDNPDCFCVPVVEEDSDED